MRIPSGKTDQLIFFVAVDSTDLKTRKTGLTTFTVYRSRNGGTATVYTTPTVAELSSANMPGVYSLTIDEDTTIASTSDSEEYCIHITQASMAPVTRTIELYRRDTTSGNTAAIDSSGRIDIGKALGNAITTTTNGIIDVNTKNINNVAAATPGASGGILISGSNSGTTTLAALTVTGIFTISDGIVVTRSTSNSDAVKLTGTGSGSGLNIIGGAAITTTAAGHAILLAGGAASTGAGGVSGNAIKATGGAGAASTNGAASAWVIAAGGTTTVSGNDAVTITGTGNGNALTLTHAGTGKDFNATTTPLTLAKTTNITGFNDLTAAAIATGVWQDSTAGDFTTASSIGKSLYTSGVVPGGTNGLFIAGTNAATTITTSLTTTFTGSLTGSVASVSGAVGSVTGAVGSVTGNVGGNVTGSVGSIASGGITRASLSADTGLQPIRSNTAAGGAATTITLDASASAVDNFYNNDIILLTGNTGVGQARFITGYVGATKVATVATWVTNPDNTTAFAILPFDAIPGASAPTAAQVATAVWTDLLASSDFSTSASIGKLLKDDIDTTISSRMATYTQPTGFLAATFPTGTIANTTNITAGTITTVTTVTNQLTAAAIATGIWQDTTAGDFTTALSVGKSIMNGVTLGTGLTVNAVTGLTASNLDTTVSSRMATYSQPTGFLAATFPTGTIANTTNITAGIITTVTNLTNAPTAGDFTATMKTSLNAATPSVTVSDKTGFSLTAAYDAAKTASQAGDIMKVSSGTGANQINLSSGNVPVYNLTATASKIKKNTAYPKFAFTMTDVTTGAGMTGLTVTGTRSIDGGAFGAVTNTVTEIGSGWYYLDLAAADVNGNVIALHLTATGATIRDLLILTQP